MSGYPGEYVNFSGPMKQPLKQRKVKMTSDHQKSTGFQSRRLRRFPAGNLRVTPTLEKGPAGVVSRTSPEQKRIIPAQVYRTVRDNSIHTPSSLLVGVREANCRHDLHKHMRHKTRATGARLPLCRTVRTYVSLPFPSPGDCCKKIGSGFSRHLCC